MSSFKNLKSFEKLEPVDEENKENIESNEHFDRGSYEDLMIPQTIADCNINEERPILSEENIESVAKAALLDLLKLVQEVR